MNSFEFKLNGQKITANDIDNKLEKSKIWQSAKRSGTLRRSRAPRSNRISSFYAISATASPGK